MYNGEKNFEVLYKIAVIEILFTWTIKFRTTNGRRKAKKIGVFIPIKRKEPRVANKQFIQASILKNIRTSKVSKSVVNLN